MKLYCYILILLQFLNLFQSYKKDGIYVTEGTSETICILGDTLLYSNGFDPVHPELPTVCKMVKAPGKSRNAYLVYTYSPLNWPIHYKMNKEYNKDEMDPIDWPGSGSLYYNVSYEKNSSIAKKSGRSISFSDEFHRDSVAIILDIPNYAEPLRVEYNFFDSLGYRTRFSGELNHTESNNCLIVPKEAIMGTTNIQSFIFSPYKIRPQNFFGRFYGSVERTLVAQLLPTEVGEDSSGVIVITIQELDPSSFYTCVFFAEPLKFTKYGFSFLSSYFQPIHLGDSVARKEIKEALIKRKILTNPQD